MFAKQDLSKDPPYSRLDLISCRNVLIYFETVLQRKVLGVFHYALEPNAVPGLGCIGNSPAAAGQFNAVRKGEDLFAQPGRFTDPSSLLLGAIGN